MRHRSKVRLLGPPTLTLTGGYIMYSDSDNRYGNDPFKLIGSEVDFEVESHDTPHFNGKMRTVTRVVRSPNFPEWGHDEDTQFLGLGVVTNKHPVADIVGRHKPYMDYFKQANDAITEKFVELGYSNALDDMTVKYKTAKDGAFALQDVIYNNINSAIVSSKRDGSLFETNFFLRSTVFRGISGNCAMNCIFGEYDGYCLNGYLFGKGNWIKKKNTSKIAEEKFIFNIGDTVVNFVQATERYKELANRKLTSFDAANVIRHLPGASARLKERVQEQYEDEAIVRGDNVLSLLSAFTHYSSHSDGAHALKVTGGDHAAQSMLTREFEISKWTESPEYLKLAA